MIQKVMITLQNNESDKQIIIHFYKKRSKQQNFSTGNLNCKNKFWRKKSASITNDK